MNLKLNSIFAIVFIAGFFAQLHAQPGYAGEWKKTRLYGHSFNSGDFTDQEYDWIRDHFEYFTIEKTHRRSTYGDPSHEITSRETATKLIQANPRCKPLMIYSIGSAYPHLFESEAAILQTNPEYFLYDAAGEPEDMNLENPGENDWYIQTTNWNTDNSDLHGIFLDGYKGAYTAHTAPVQYISDRMTGYRLVNGMDFAPNGLTIRGWPECLNYSDGVFIDAFFRRRVMTKDAGVVLIDACLNIPEDQMFVCFSAYDGYSPTFEFSHAAYLIVAHENTYYRWVDSGHLWNSSSLMTWHDVFDKEMGEPLGKAVKNGYVYTRVFQYCTVTLDVENITSHIEWGQNNTLGLDADLNAEDRTLLIYPNPVIDTVTFKLKTSEPAEYKIVNNIGQVVLTGIISNGSTSVDLSSLSSGIYTARVNTGSKTQSKKIIKE
ncbi:T9SS type A sorting domain-containing protein [Tamlana agarivorans]|uniref:T9SS type A sorting domain-containing protein n=1 Tax=Pseudotamlana agarivorans TaxID=481183 RepID=A0ACC5U9G9_9FLAO|nr:T9SS type A sorting domain-containing protein [Tamlana agarivorans]MBU2950951.1 T9SS type A sorting domain-containing protein [Tamlana agarivorans]